MYINFRYFIIVLSYKKGLFLMEEIVEKLKLINKKISKIISNNNLSKSPEIIAISKTFNLEKITPLLKFGHIHFGENKVQEAENKWSQVKNTHKKLQLHMVGKLQSNKVKKAIQLFDYIHSLDSESLAKKISIQTKELNKKTKIFIQVNTGEENQKSGIYLNQLSDFYKFCVKELSLNVIGLMCLPPLDADTHEHFKILKEKSIELNLQDLSMGMSSDYENATINGATFLRLGTEIFGKRNI